MSRVFKTRGFARWMKKAGLQDEDLCLAVAEMRSGLIDADLGGGIVKKRIALPGRGKRGSTRTIVATNRDDRWFFIFGFAKSELETVSPDALWTLQQNAEGLLKISPSALDSFVAAGSLTEICDA